MAIFAAVKQGDDAIVQAWLASSDVEGRARASGASRRAGSDHSPQPGAFRMTAPPWVRLRHRRASGSRRSRRRRGPRGRRGLAGNQRAADLLTPSRCPGDPSSFPGADHALPIGWARSSTRRCSASSPRHGGRPFKGQVTPIPSSSGSPDMDNSVRKQLGTVDDRTFRPARFAVSCRADDLRLIRVECRPPSELNHAAAPRPAARAALWNVNSGDRSARWFEPLDEVPSTAADTPAPSGTLVTAPTATIRTSSRTTRWPTLPFPEGAPRGPGRPGAGRPVSALSTSIHADLVFARQGDGAVNLKRLRGAEVEDGSRSSVPDPHPRSRTWARVDQPVFGQLVAVSGTGRRSDALREASCRGGLSEARDVMKHPQGIGIAIGSSSNAAMPALRVALGPGADFSVGGERALEQPPDPEIVGDVGVAGVADRLRSAGSFGSRTSAPAMSRGLAMSTRGPSACEPRPRGCAPSIRAPRSPSS